MYRRVGGGRSHERATSVAYNVLNVLTRFLPSFIRHLLHDASVIGNFCNIELTNFAVIVHVKQTGY